MLNEVEFTGDLAGLFYPGVDRRSQQQLNSCEWAFKNLTLNYIESTWPEIIHLVRFDDVKLEMMLRRFYRDAFGVGNFRETLKELCPDDGPRVKIWNEVRRLGIRISSPNPRKTRIAAVFSLWMSTFRPIYLSEKPPQGINVWHLDAATNFYLATSFLEFFGTIRIGIEGRDRDTRNRRILYDLTCRDLNLSSLEMLYCSVFEPDLSLIDNKPGGEEDEADMDEKVI